VPGLSVRGIAMGGDQGAARVEISADGGRRWVPARLGPDQGRYSFRRFEAELPLAGPGRLQLLSRATNSAGETQSLAPTWNPSGFLRQVAERVTVTVA
jgi:hypothetical protein